MSLKEELEKQPFIQALKGADDFNVYQYKLLIEVFEDQLREIRNEATRESQMLNHSTKLSEEEKRFNEGKSEAYLRVKQIFKKYL